jgi:hypothetical protein
MADRRIASNGRDGTRSRLASAMLVLLPGFIFLGFLAPAAVTVHYEGEEETVRPLTFRNFQLPFRRPMIASEKTVQAASRGSEFEAIRELLASGTRLIARGAREALAFAKLEMNSDDRRIVLEAEEVEEDVVERLFDATRGRDAILVADLTPLWESAVFDVIPAPLRTWGEHVDDDFVGPGLVFREPVPQPVAIPEPESAALVLIGLTVLGIRRIRH